MIPWLIAVLHALSPHRTEASFRDLAAAIAELAADPLPGLDARTSAAVVAQMAFEESSLVNDIVGDNGHSHCMMQIHFGDPKGGRTREGWSPVDLRNDVRKCLAVGYRILRGSFGACPAHPLAPYARGSCTSEQGIKISDRRMAKARALLGVVARPETKEVK